MGLEGKNLRPATQDRIITHVRAAISRAIKAKLLRDNPFKGERVRWDPKDSRIYSSEEIGVMIEAAPSDWWRLFIALLAGTGLRLGEALYLRWETVDLAAGRVSVSPQDAADWSLGETTLRLPAWTAKAPKSYRVLPLSSDLIARLTVWKVKAGNTPYVFLGIPRIRAISSRIARATWRQNEVPVSSLHPPFRTIQKRAKALLAKRRGVEVQEVAWRLGTPHDLRDTYIMVLANNGVPMHVASRMAGHSDIKITERFYLHAAAEDDRRVLAALAAADRGAVSGTNREQMVSAAV